MIVKVNGFRVSEGFGVVSKVHPHGHTGVDLATPVGTPLYAVQDGHADVVNYGNINIGKGVLVHHSDGSKDIYGHMSKWNVVDGQEIHKGDLIGWSGNTGHSTGPHLHFGERLANGKFVDPSQYVKDAVTPPVHDIHTIAQVKGEMISQVIPHSFWETVQTHIVHFGSTFIHILPTSIFLAGVSLLIVNYVNQYIARKINIKR